MDGDRLLTDNPHTGAVLLLLEARRVAVLRKAERDAYYARVKVARGAAAAVNLVKVVNTVRRAEKRGEE